MRKLMQNSYQIVLQLWGSMEGPRIARVNVRVHTNFLRLWPCGLAKSLSLLSLLGRAFIELCGYSDARRASKYVLTCTFPWKVGRMRKVHMVKRWRRPLITCSCPSIGEEGRITTSTLNFRLWEKLVMRTDWGTRIRTRHEAAPRHVSTCLRTDELVGSSIFVDQHEWGKVLSVVGRT